jgi:hypothetical protein
MNQETTNNNVTNVFKELNKTIEAIGSDRLIEILKYSRKSVSSLTDEQIEKAELIIALVCEEFDISLQEFFSARRKNNRRYAIGICALFFQNNIGIDNSDIAYILKKPQSTTSTYKNDILLLKENHPVDSSILQKIQNIKNKLNNTQHGLQ